MKYYRYYYIFIFFKHILANIITFIFCKYIQDNIEKENYSLKKKINYIEDQININEIEYSLYNSYEYLVKVA